MARAVMLLQGALLRFAAAVLILACHPLLQGPVHFCHAAFVPPGYASLLFSHLYEPSSCPLPTTLFAGFRQFMLEAFGLAEQPTGAGGAAVGAAAGTRAGAGMADGSGNSGSSAGSGDGSSNDPSRALTVFLISRRPSGGKRKMARQVGNEGELVAAVQALGSSGSELAVSLLDFAGMPCEWGSCLLGCLLSCEMPLLLSECRQCPAVFPTAGFPGLALPTLQWRSSWRRCSGQTF